MLNIYLDFIRSWKKVEKLRGLFAIYLKLLKNKRLKANLNGASSVLLLASSCCNETDFLVGNSNSLWGTEKKNLEFIENKMNATLSFFFVTSFSRIVAIYNQNFQISGVFF